MNLEINQIASTAINKNNNNDVSEKNANKEEKPQLKEHCSSKAAKALRGMALGLALAAGVASSKGMVVQAAGNNNYPVADNNIAVTQEVEKNSSTSEVEKMADAILNQEESGSDIHVGGRVRCQGEMIETRNYDKAEITSDGQLVFFDEQHYSEFETKYQMNYNGKFEYCTRLNDETKYVLQNSFNLGTEVNDSTIKLQPGTKFNEADETNGDYVELAEDGKTFNVYDSSGKQIGSCQFMTPEEAAENLEKLGKALKGFGIVTGIGMAGTAIGATIYSKSKIY